MARIHQLQSTGDQLNLPMRGKLHPVRTLSHRNVTSLVTLGLLAFACSSNNSGPTASLGGGTSTSTGGTSASTGGNSAVATGGNSASTGGHTGAQGGATAVGGTSNVASAAGGAATGGNSSSSVGGASATGGKSSSSAGGASATGGKSSSSVGGSATGGASAAGGTSGDATGGASAAGGKSSTGGAAAGGATNATGGATSAGGTAAGGGSSCAAATITKVSGSDYQLKVCDVTLDADPTIGGRIASLTIASTSIIEPHTATTYTAGDASNMTGITFWTSPQSGWGANTWPPVAAIDGNAYTVTDDGSASGHLVLSGSADTTLGAKVTKDISADSSTGWITIKYTITATKAIQAAPWQIARVPRAGLVYFPCSTAAIKSPTVTWTLSQTGGYDWIDDKSQTTVSAASDGSKYVVDGAAVSGQTYTWLAYALNGNLLLFKYPDVAKASFATGEADTEVYPGAGYVELESQGAYTSIAAAGTLSWTIQVRVVPIPNSVTVGANSTTLTDFTEQQAAL